MTKNKEKSLSTRIATISAIALLVVFTLLILITTFFKAITFANSFSFLIGFYLISLIVLVLIIFTVSKQTLKPLKDIAFAAESLSKGDLDIKLDTNRNDEIGEVATAFNTTAITLKNIIADINYLLDEMANCNFTISSNKKNCYVGEFSQILKSAQSIKANLSDTLSQINEASFQVDLGSEQVSTASQALSEGSVEQANSVEELSATISEIANHVKLNAQNAQNASIQSNEAGSGVMESNSQMTEMISAMNDITAKSNEIGKIIKTIEDIAFQTNILALNAAVEAARAGTAGKGFAVVADEVRNLATKSAEAAKNTTALIEQTVSAVAHGSRIADDTATSLLAVVNKASNVTALIGEIAKASEDQSNSIAQVTFGVDRISGVVQTNSATAEESAAASQELNAQADMLKNLVDKFKIDKISNIGPSKNITKATETKYIEKNNLIITPPPTKVQPEKVAIVDKSKEKKLFVDKPEVKEPIINKVRNKEPDKKLEATIEKKGTFKPIVESPQFEAKSNHTTVPKADTPAGTAINDFSDKY